MTATGRAEMFYEDINPGQEIVSRSRVITAADVEVFTSLTWAANPLFLSDASARERGFPARVVPAALIISFVIGLLYQTGLFDHITALVGVDRLSMKAPSHPGDVISVRCRVLEKRETKSPDRGFVKFFIECLNSTRNAVVMEAEMSFLYLRKNSR
ncbi:MAG: MaoC/PaaZ C-terminal domain-containing protein [Nitrososphaerota archaeon]